MNVVAIKILRKFWEKFPDSEQHLKAWVDEVRNASWSQHSNTKEKYRNASILKNRRVVFNIKGNDYRVVAAVAYRFQAVYIKFIGAHKEYDAINAETIEQENRRTDMDIHPIRTNEDYQTALREISAFFDNEPVPGTPEGDRFEVLLTLVSVFEAKQFPIDLPDPVEAIKFRMEQAGLTAKDLVPAIGRLNRVYEILNRKRPLTLRMIWKLHNDLGIPAESLVRPPKNLLAA